MAAAAGPAEDSGVAEPSLTVLPPGRPRTMWETAEYAGLDHGIRFAVKVLHARGIETEQSCQGGPGHSYDWPTVDLPSTACRAEGFAALAALADYGLPVTTVSLLWTVDALGFPVERLWRITFARPMPERADDEPIFLWSYSQA